MNYNKKILKICTISIIILVPLIKFLSLYLESLGIIKHFDSINPAIILYVLSFILLLIYIIELKKTKRKLDKYDYIFYILILTGILSIVFSINKNMAIFGKTYRHEGFLSVLSYYLLFINWKVQGTKKDIKDLLNLLIIICIISCIYSILQIYTSLPFIVRFKLYNFNMASGFYGNPNFFGSLIVTILSIVSCQYLLEEKVNIKKLLIIILLFITLINVQSTGPFLTYILYLLLVYLFFMTKKIKVNKVYVILILCLIVVYTFISTINNIYLKKQNSYLDEYSVKGLKGTIFKGGNGRLEIWKNSINIIKKHSICGVGFDNFVYFYPNPKPKDLVIFGMETTDVTSQSYKICDNAHNVYLHTLVSTGILGLIPYLILCLLTFLKGLKSNDKLMFVLLSGFASYSIQAFANISVIQVAPIYYIIIGLMLSDSFDKTHI